MDPGAAITVILQVLPALGNSSEELALAGQLESLCHFLASKLPLSFQNAHPRCAFHVDQAIAVAELGIFLIGWCNAGAGSIAQLSCHSGTVSVDMGEHWIRHPRPDVSSFLAAAAVPGAADDHGYSCFVPLPRGDGVYFITIKLTSGEVGRVAVNLSNERPVALEAIRSTLSSFSSAHPELLQLLDRHVGPAVSALWESRYRRRGQPLVRRYGPDSQPNPSLSIIVPLFGRYDLAEYQLALFADDPQIRGSELLYIVDDPTIAHEFSALCADLYCTYRVPFTLIDPGSNLGFAGANNCAARIARGSHLLLLNSDVFPKRPGWAGAMLELYRSLPDTGLLGAKLLYEDGSVQHAGMEFRRYADWGDMWINYHPHKGQSPSWLSGVKEVDAVTAACALIEAALFREIGGLCEDYIIGDFEDSDLCLRAHARGRVNRVALDIELYHLERQSQNRVGDAQWRTNLTVYNCWLHHRRWGQLMERQQP
jgi:GT2 family glycosyltransferase